MDPAVIDKLPLSLKNIDITGGEPLLHRQFAAIVDKLLRRGCRVIVNTNGILSLDAWKEVWVRPGVGVRLSLDGIGEKHDSLRGIEGNYESVVRNIEYLISLGITDIGISSTFSDVNIDQARDLYMFARVKGIKFTMMAVVNSKLCYRKEDNNKIADVNRFTREVLWVADRERKTLDPERWGKATYLDVLAKFLKGEIKRLNCPAAKKFFFMTPEADIFACNIRDLYIGNIGTASFESTWFSERGAHAGNVAAHCATPCWTMCNAKNIMLMNPVHYLGVWITGLPRIFG
jgi:MoaA/NifB/PqqE/SkfB family radical SAM enzyme